MTAMDLLLYWCICGLLFFIFASCIASPRWHYGWAIAIMLLSGPVVWVICILTFIGMAIVATLKEWYR